MKIVKTKACRPTNDDEAATGHIHIRTTLARNLRIQHLKREITQRNAALVELQRINTETVQGLKDEQTALHQLNHRHPGQPDRDELAASH
jgi:hypothetical protein